jgi:DNA-binding MarR family transcriptional regulator
MNQRAGLLALLNIAYAAQAQVESRLADSGLSLAKLLALEALADAGEPTALSELAARLSCVKSNITQLVDRLEADGLVRRQFDANDRRARLATLTAAGRRAFSTGTRVRQQAERALLGSLSDRDRRQLTTLLEKLGRRIR